MPVINTQGSLSSTDEFGSTNGPYNISLVGAKKIVPSDDGTRIFVLTSSGASVYTCPAGGGDYTLEQSIALPTGYTDTMDGDLNGSGDKLLVSFQTSAGNGRVVAYTRTGSVWTAKTTANEALTTTGYKFGESVSLSDGNGCVISQYSSADITPGKNDGYVYYYGNIFSTSASVATTRTQLVRYTASNTSSSTWPRNVLITVDGNYVKVHQRDVGTNTMIAADIFSVTTGTQSGLPTTAKFHEMSVKAIAADWSKDKLGRLFSAKIYSGDKNVSIETDTAMTKLVITWGLVRTSSSVTGTSTSITVINKNYSFTAGVRVYISPVVTSSTTSSLLYNHKITASLGSTITSPAIFYMEDINTTLTVATATGGQGFYTYSISPSLPTGLTIDSQTGKITNNNVSALMPSTKYSITSTDSAYNTTSTDVYIRVVAPRLKAVYDGISSIAASTIIIENGTYYQAKLLSSEDGTAPISYSISPAPPTGLSFSNGNLSGTPTASGATDHIITLSDSIPTIIKTPTITIRVFDGPLSSMTQVNGSVLTGVGGGAISNVVSFTIKGTTDNEYFKIAWGVGWTNIGGIYDQLVYVPAGTSKTFSETLSTTTLPDGRPANSYAYSYTIRIYGKSKPSVTSKFSVI